MRATKGTKTALLVVDVQNGVVQDAYQRESVIQNIRSLISKAKEQGAPVIWIQHCSDELQENSEPWQYVKELRRDPNDPHVLKRHCDSFEDTSLKEILDKLQIGHLIVTGAQTDACIRATIHGAFVRGYNTTLVGDAHTTQDHSAYGMPTPDKIIALTNMYWTWQSGPGRTAKVVNAEEVSFV